jgi:hypothetical protein
MLGAKMPNKNDLSEVLPEFLKTAVAESGYSWSTMLVRVLAAALLGLFVAWVFRLTHGREKRDARVMATTLVLLTILICMVTLVIRDNVARAFSLVGALSIVRFRTVVEDTRDTAFVILAVVVGMGCGTGLLVVPLLGLPLVALVALGMNRGALQVLAAQRARSKLTVRLALGFSPEQSLSPVLTRWLPEAHLVAVETARQGAALELTYEIVLRQSADMPSVVADLNRVEGVQHVELQMLE